MNFKKNQLKLSKLLPSPIIKNEKKYDKTNSV